MLRLRDLQIYRCLVNAISFSQALSSELESEYFPTAAVAIKRKVSLNAYPKYSILAKLLNKEFNAQISFDVCVDQTTKRKLKVRNLVH